MTNINHFYPLRLKGWALGVNAGGGNLGVPVVQLVGLLILATLGAQHPSALVVIYIPLIVLSALGAALMMNNLSQASNAQGAIREVMRHRETWIMSLLYVGTFGSSSASASHSGRCSSSSSRNSSRPPSRRPR
jgi:MFS transporter, NNP family, nitrate/nitrite transporter